MEEGKYKSGEEDQQQLPRGGGPRRKGRWPKAWIVGLAVVAVALVVFGVTQLSSNGTTTSSSGATTSKSGHATGTTSSQGSDAQTQATGTSSSQVKGTSGGAPSNVVGGTVGKVTAASAKSITIDPSDGGSPKTFTVESFTMMMQKSASKPGAYDASAIHTGQTVTIITGPSGTSGANLAVTVLLFAQS